MSRERWNIGFSKVCFWIFYLYMNFYKEAITERRIVLYGSVFLMTVLLLLDINITDGFVIASILKSFIVFGIYASISGLIVSTSYSTLASTLITYFEYIVVLVDCCLISNMEGSWEWILPPMVITAILCSIKTIFLGYQFMNGGAIATSMAPKNNPNSLAYVIILGLFALLVVKKQGAQYFVFKIILTVMFLYTIILTGSRKCLLSAGILVGIWLLIICWDSFSNINSIGSWIILILVGTAVLGGIWYFYHYYIYSAQYTRLLNALFNKNGANDTRLQLYRDAFAIWETSPIFGVGFGQFSLHSSFWVGYYSHSTYAETLSCTGIIGCILLFFPVLRYSIRMLKSLRVSKTASYTIGMCFAAVLVEWFLGIGQIWFYGFNHMFFFLCFTSIFESKIDIPQTQAIGRVSSRYLRNNNVMASSRYLREVHSR